VKLRGRRPIAVAEVAVADGCHDDCRRNDGGSHVSADPTFIVDTAWQPDRSRLCSLGSRDGSSGIRRRGLSSAYSIRHIKRLGTFLRVGWRIETIRPSTPQIASSIVSVLTSLQAKHLKALIPGRPPAFGTT
jgi:hypothetical protein